LDTIQKFFKRLWLLKERFVLVILLGFLAVNIYKIFDPKVEQLTVQARLGTPPQAELPEPRRGDAPGSYESLYRRNPLSYYSDAKLDGSNRLTAEEVGIHLIQIQKISDTKWRAQLRTKTPKWYNEGESFEEFTLEKINPEDQTVDVYAERFATSITLEIEQ
tara:strand:+ start:628 stop:1113 length:486 start_codon:yes stop_codon:yes gene_type:complete